MTKYDYLKKYIYDPKTYPAGGFGFNVCFSRVNKKEIIDSEKKAETIFPGSLKEFWMEIGGGYFRQSINTSSEDSDDSDNELREPAWIAQVITDPEEGDWLYYADDSNEEMLEKEYFPFFNAQGREYFLWMKPGSDSVYAPDEEIIEEDFEDFIYNLYHIHPSYYWKKICSEKSWLKNYGDMEKAVDENWHLGRHKNKT